MCYRTRDYRRTFFGFELDLAAAGLALDLLLDDEEDFEDFEEDLTALVLVPDIPEGGRRT